MKILKPIRKVKVACKTVIAQSEIMYLESASNYTCIHTIKKQLVSSRTLKIFATKVDSDCFIKINRGLIINVSYIDDINAERKAAFIMLKNGTKLPISRRKYNEVINSLDRNY